MTDEETKKNPEEERELPPEMEEMIDFIPEEKREEARQMFGISMSRLTRTSPAAEMVKRMTPENFQQILQNEAEETKLAYRDKSETRKTAVMVIGVIVLFMIMALFVLKDQPETLKEIVVPLLTFAAGALGGYGFCSRRKSGD